MTHPAPSTAVRLIPLVLVVFAAYLVVGAAIPVLPLHVTGGLGMTTFVVGLVSGAQFAAALVSRLVSGRFADRRGGKRAILAGLLIATAAGIFYLTSMTVLPSPRLSVAVLLLGRAVLGAGESFIISGALSWGLATAGTGNTGKVMSWVGIAMYIGFSLGGPVGATLYALSGFGAVGLATLLVPAAAWLVVRRLQAPRLLEEVPVEVEPSPHLLGIVWLPGVALAFASVGFGALTTFAPLLLLQRQWGASWTAFSAFSLAFVFARLLFGHLPDRFGGAKVAIISILVETLGQWLAWQASGLPVLLLGAMLTGLGYALVYPALGVEAMRLAPARSRALAMGAYTAFLDLMLGVGSPLLGLVAGHSGVQSVFAVGAATAAGSAVLAVWLNLVACRRMTAAAN